MAAGYPDHSGSFCLVYILYPEGKCPIQRLLCFQRTAVSGRDRPDLGLVPGIDVKCYNKVVTEVANKI